MPKSKMKLSRNDEKILNALMVNARQSLIEISEKTGVTRQTVQKTISKLEKDHVIWGYQVVVDEQKKGFSHFLILIKRTIKPLDGKVADKIISRKLEEIAADMGVTIVTSVYSNGYYEWVISFMAIDIRHAKKFTEHVKALYSEYIADIHLLETLFFVKKQGIANPNVKNLKQFV